MTTADHWAAELAARQHGVIARTQLLELGASPRTIARRVDEGRWKTVTRGVYLIGGFEPSAMTQLMAATLLVPGSVVSHLSAGRLHELEPLPPAAGVEDIAVIGRQRRKMDGCRIHSVMSLDEVDRTIVDKLPCTTVARTIVDLGAVLRPKRLEAVLDRATASGLALEEVTAAFARVGRRGRAGTQVMRALLDARAGDSTVATSALEGRFLDLVRTYDLPEPETQWLPPWAAERGFGRVDFAYPAARLVIEVDGRRWHATAAAFVEDRRRDQRASAAGWTTLRFSWSDIVHRPDAVATTIRACLENAAAA